LCAPCAAASIPREAALSDSLNANVQLISAVKLLVLHSNRMDVLCHYRPSYDQLDVMGGKVEPGEKLADALMREVSEELNSNGFCLLQPLLTHLTNSWPSGHAQTPDDALDRPNAESPQRHRVHVWVLPLDEYHSQRLDFSPSSSVAAQHLSVEWRPIQRLQDSITERLPGYGTAISLALANYLQPAPAPPSKPNANLNANANVSSSSAAQPNPAARPVAVKRSSRLAQHDRRDYSETARRVAGVYYHLCSFRGRHNRTQNQWLPTTLLTEPERLEARKAEVAYETERLRQGEPLEAAPYS
jgi:8-oxo-dGTP pyrophosphatase MutT (NUDIX family)